MNLSTLQLFNRSTFAALAFAAFAATTAHAEYKLDKELMEVTNLWLRVSAPEAKGAKVQPVVTPTRKPAFDLEPAVVGEDGMTGWIRMPRLGYRRFEWNKGRGFDRYVYQGCVLNIRKDGKYVDEATVGLEVAEASDGAPVLTLPAQEVAGGVVCAIFTDTRIGAPHKAKWFSDHLASIEKTLAEAGYGEIFLPKGMMVYASWNINGWHKGDLLTRDPKVHAQLTRLLRMLGVNCQSLGKAEEDFIMGAWANFTRNDAIDDKWREQTRKAWKDFAAGLAANKNPKVRAILDSRGLDTVTVGDEALVLQGYAKSPAFRDRFEEERERIAPDLPEGAEITYVNEHKIDRPETREGRLSRYVAVRARNRESAAVWKATADYAEEALGSQVRVKNNFIPWYAECGGQWSQTLIRTPDLFQLARMGSMELPEVQGMTSAYPPAGPLATVLLAPMFAAQMRELNTRPDGSSSLMLFPCRVEAAAYEHAFMSAFLNGDTTLSLYSLGFHATVWESLDEESKKLLGIARCTHWLPQIAPYVLGQKRQKADIAILATEATDTWRWKGKEYCKNEMRGSAYALRFSGYRVDYVREHMVEDGLLDGYKVLWATMRHANRLVQRKILEWVEAGGTLVLTPGALVRDEADDPIDLFAAYRAEGVQPSDYENCNCTEFDYKKRDTSAPVRETAVGKGRIVAFPWMPGMNFCAGSARARERFRDETTDNVAKEYLNNKTLYGVAYWMEGDEAVREKIAAVAEAAGATRQIKLSQGNIDAGVLDDGLRAFVGFANYNVGPTKDLVAEFTLKKRYDCVKTLDGAPVKVEWNSTTAHCTFDLADAQALLFK